jgi:tyrosyl-tRNA synthetase
MSDTILTMVSDDRLVQVTRALERRISGGGNAFPSLNDAAQRITNESGLLFYFGIDPTGPSVHIGHTIPLLLLADLVRLGHKAILLIGDFTARIGDPDKAAARTALSEEQVQANMSSYVEQVKRVIPGIEFETRYNSEWLSTLTMEQIMRLTSKATVQQMIARDMFQERLKNERPIYVSEFLYPLLQGYDAVVLRVDGEVGGNDQTFNMLVGRDLERELIGKDKIVLAVRLLVDSATGKKMSKTEGHLIAVDDSPQEIRRKVLALDDSMTQTVFELCTDKPIDWIRERVGDPRAFKEALAEELIRMYQGEKAVSQAKEKETLELDGLPLDKGLVVTGAASSVTGAHNFIDGGGVELNGGKVETKNWKQPLKSGDEIKIGKGRFIKVK